MAGQPLNLQGLVNQKAIQQQVNKAITTANSPGTQQLIQQGELQAGIATGSIDPKSLTPEQTQLLAQGIQPPPKTGGIGGVLGDIGSGLGTIGSIGLSNAGDFARDVEGVPQGIAGTVKAAYNTGREIGGINLPKGQLDLGGEAKGIAKGTIQDFTHFTPYHALNPLLDVATLASGGATGAVRASSALGRAAEAGGKLGDLAKPFAEASTVKKLSAMANPLSRPIAEFHPASADQLAEGAELPKLPDRNYSTSPARQLFLERPIDRLFNSRIAELQIPGLDKGTTLQDLRSNYYARRYGNVMRPLMNPVGAVAKASHNLVERGIALYKEQGKSRAKFNDAHDAAIMSDQLLNWDRTPDDREAALDQYIEKVLTPQHYDGPINDTPEAEAIRDYRYKKYNSDSYRRLIREPTQAMRDYANEQHNVVHNELRRLDIDPNEVLERSLGPAAHVFGKSTDELLRERPEKQSMDFARITHDMDHAVRTGDENAPELQYRTLVANMIPSPVSLAQKQSLVDDATESLKADLMGSSRELLNNADNTGYLQGRTLAQKIATGMRDRLGVDDVTAENYMTGGMTNYFPQYSYARGHHIIYADNMIQRRLNNLKGQRNEKVLSAYRRSNPTATLSSKELLGPVASFLKQSDLEAFRAGVDMREPQVFSRHIAQVERELVKRSLSSRMINDLALKDSQKLPVLLDNDQERYSLFNSTVQADKWTTLPASSIGQLFDSEGQAARQLIPILEGAKGRELSPAEYEQIQNISDESAQDFVNQTIDEVNSGNKLVVLPKAYVNNLINHAKILDKANGKGLLSKYSGFIHYWRQAVLSYMPAWLLRTSVGHGIVLFISGVGPGDYARAAKYFGDESGTKLGKAFSSKGGGDVPVGVNQGSMHEELGGARRGPVSDVLLGNKAARTITGTVHNIANFQRRAAFLHSLNKGAKGRMGDLNDSFTFKYPHAFSDPRNIEDVIKNHPEMVRAAQNELNRVSYTFGQMSPWERQLAKYILPFWGWYKFISKFVWSMPITYPGRTLALTQLGQIGSSDFDKLGPIPDWLRNSILIDTHNLGALRYLPLTGINPLADVVNPTEGLQGIVGLSQTSPLIQAGLEGMGINPLTGGEEGIDPTSGIVNVNGTWYNSNTGKSYDDLGEASVAADLERMVGGLARTFPELNILEQGITGGRSVYPESIPVLDEKIKGKTASKNESVAGIAGQLSGIKPASYNSTQELLYQEEDLRRAALAVAKAKARQ